MGIAGVVKVGKSFEVLLVSLRVTVLMVAEAAAARRLTQVTTFCANVLRASAAFMP